MRPFLQYIRAGDMLPRLFWFYRHLPEQWVLDLIHKVYAKARPPWDEWLDHHAVNFPERLPNSGHYYQVSKEPYHLDQVEYWYRQHMLTWGQMPGGIFAADERIRPGCVDPRQAFEPCGMVEFAKAFYDMLRITGDASYADRAEEVILNHFPTSMTADLKAIHYLSAANQPQQDSSTKHPNRNKGLPMYMYTPHNRCCGHNIGIGWPYYVRNLWQATMDGGLAAVLYGPSTVTAKVGDGGDEVRIQQKTQYPFKEDIELIVHPEGTLSFPLYLRIPEWCSEPMVQVNGEIQEIEAGVSGYVCIERQWQPGDRVMLQLSMAVKLKRWPRNGSASIYRGPLAYSLKIDERWQQSNEVDYQGKLGTPEWPQWEAFPGTPWNYGLVLDDSGNLLADEVKLSTGLPDQPFDANCAPVTIRTRGKQIPAWSLQENTAAELQNSPVISDQPIETIELIPLCCARLRMSCLPVIGQPPVAKAWQPVEAVIPDDEWPKNRFDEMYPMKQGNIGQQ